MTSYDTLAYPSLPLAQTSPDRLLTQAVLLGCRIPGPAGLRVLEIGCSDAGNLAWLAAYDPGSQYVGVDSSQAAVARARALSTEMGNLTVEVGDLRTLDAGRFDIVIAHGVYSWIRRPTDLLECIDRHLAPDGIAYVSYNAQPGSYLRTMVGDVLRRVSAGRPDPVAAARRFMDAVAAGGTDTPHARLLREAMALSAEKPDHVLAHDELGEHNHAVYVQDFAADAARHRLVYLGEAHLADSQPGDTVVPAEFAAADEVRRQQVLDYLRNRSFRQTLLVRPHNRPADFTVDPARLDTLWIAAPARQVDVSAGRTTMRLLSGVEVTTDGAGLIADLRLLGQAWPGSVPVRDLASPRRALLSLYLARAVDLRVRPAPSVMPGDRPMVLPFARHEALAGRPLATPRHDVVTLDDDLARSVVSRMDGTSTRAALAASVEQHRNAPRGPGGTAAALDELLAGLGEAGLMLG